jgi:hypothetical protein
MRISAHVEELNGNISTHVTADLFTMTSRQGTNYFYPLHLQEVYTLEF